MSYMSYRPLSQPMTILGVLFLVGGIVFLNWWARRKPQSDSEAQISYCRTRYAAARSHADTLKVDYHLVPLLGGRTNRRGYSNCGVYRTTGHF